MSKNTFIIPFISAILLSGLLYLSIPVHFEKFFLETVFVESRIPRNQVDFADVTGDGIDELIESGGMAQSHYGKFTSCLVRRIDKNYDIHTIDQINFSEILDSKGQFFMADYNGNGKDEIYVANVNENEVFINAYEYPEFNVPFAQIRIDSFVHYNGRAEVRIGNSFSHDVNNDGLNEVYFTLTNTYPVYPRKYYRWDIKNNTLISSPSTCMQLNHLGGKIKTKNGFYFTGNSGLPGNAKDSLNIPYSDYFGYAWVLDQDLKFVFEPQPIIEFPGGMANFIYKDFLFCYGYNQGETIKTILQKRDIETGEIINQRTFSPIRSVLKVINNQLVIVEENQIKIMDENLNDIPKATFDQKIQYTGNRIMDVDRDGKKEIIDVDINSKKLLIISSDLKTATWHDIPFINNTPIIKIKHNQNSIDLVIGSESEFHYLRYKENPWYWLQYPYYLSLLIVSGFVSFISFSSFKKSLEKKHQQELEMNRLQMLAIKNQVDPHFTLNALNSIDFMYQNNEQQKAGKFMVKLSRLMHQTLMNSDKMVCTLYSELDLIRTYCQIEQIRATKDFDFEITVDEKVDTLELIIPKQLLFTYVENAIKHGIRPSNIGGNLNIDVSKKENIITITIIDNGIGIEKSKKLKTTGTGKGLKIIKDIKRLYKEQKGIAITSETSSSQTGTTVTIRIPLVNLNA